jgi:hypothetical protein
MLSAFQGRKFTSPEALTGWGIVVLGYKTPASAEIIQVAKIALPIRAVVTYSFGIAGSMETKPAWLSTQKTMAVWQRKPPFVTDNVAL